jgi:hypothetical protein
MLKFFLTISTLVSVSLSVYCQDIITLNSGDDIETKILEVNNSTIKYKKYKNQDGPTFTVSKSDILLIRYEDGTKDVFSQTSEKPSDMNDSMDMRMKGKHDSQMNYKGKRSGAGWTAATTLVLTPLAGIIPAVACSTSEPSDTNLEYPNTELMKNYDYNMAYVEQAHKTKKRKVWTSFGISSGAWILLIILL